MKNKHAEWMIERFKDKPTFYYQMANEELADSCFPEIKKVYPDAKMFKTQPYNQFITITQEAEKKLKVDLIKEQTEMMAKVVEIENIITALGGR